jgi:O-antigen ligase
MADGFTYPRNQSSARAQAISVGKGEFTSSADGPPLIQRLGWLAAVFAVIVQQGAFVSSPVLSNLVAEVGAPDAQANILNSLAVFLNIMLIAPLCLLHCRKLAPIIYGNRAAIALIVLMFLSTIWSIHPDVTVRRCVNYFSTILTACYLAGRFDVDEAMKILSWGIAISAVCSFLFVAAFPIDAVHQPSLRQVEEIAGAWRGVFSHKNVLGHTMTVGVIVELYILSGAKVRTAWHALLLCGFLALVILSRSTTGILLASFYLVGASLFFLLQRARQYFGVGLAMLAVFGATIGAIYWTYPNAVFGFLGSDATLTGRTELWAFVLRLIAERPLLGWGYSAMWLPSDTITIAISRAVGWTVPQAHNALLEVTLEMGLTGLAIVITFVAVSLWRSMRCLMAGQQKLGMLSLVFFLGVIISGATESTLAQNQTIEWVVFNVLSFSCGLEIMRRQVGKETS